MLGLRTVRHTAVRDIAFDDDWDAGDLGCGELVIRLRFKLRSMPPGTVIRVRATDPGAPADLPAWCRLTGETLVATDPERHLYFIRRGGR
jgi:tRNA 2-thiouridine synthesizing protein A